MADTLEQMAKRLLLYNDRLPQALAELWIRDRWRQACESRPWSFLRAGGVLTIPASYSTGTLTLTQGSAAVVGVGTTFTSAMLQRQLKVGSSGPIFTVTTFTDATHIELDTAWPIADVAGQAYIILQAYVTMPADFLTFLSLVDSANLRRLHVNYYSKSDLDRIDPGRSSTGTSILAAAFQNYINPTTLVEYPRYELWPHPTGLRALPYQYIKRAADLTTTSVLPRIVTGDVLVEGALADLCRWPGPSKEDMNPMFNLALAMEHEKRFQIRVAEAGRNDDENYAMDLSYGNNNVTPLSANYAQAHGMPEIDSDINW